MEIDNLKSILIKKMRILLKEKMNLESEGNISLRFKDGFLISQSALNPLNMKKENVISIDFNGRYSLGANPSSEWKMHHSLYKSFKNANAIVHCHSNWASILSCHRKKIPPFHYMVAEMGGDDVRCAKYATFGTEKLARNVINAIKKRKACLISNHGQVTIGEDIEEAMHLAFALEKLSKQFYFCMLSNKYRLLSKSEMTESISLFSSYKTKH